MLATIAVGGCASEGGDTDALDPTRGPVRGNGDDETAGGAITGATPGAPAPSGGDTTSANGTPSNGTPSNGAAPSLVTGTEGAGDTVRLDSVNKLWVKGDGIGPKKPVGK